MGDVFLRLQIPLVSISSWGLTRLIPSLFNFAVSSLLYIHTPLALHVFVLDSVQRSNAKL